jgi:phage terminase large subunit-like protein
LTTTVEHAGPLAEVLRLIPGYDPFATAEDAWLDEAAARRAIDFFPSCLHHIEGDIAGQPFVLEPWQQAFVGNLFGWMVRDEKGRTVRRYREALLLVGRKNGKTPLIAGVTNYVLFCDGEPGAQIVGLAADTDQASLLYRHASGMVEAEPELSKRARIYRGLGQRAIEYPATNGVYRVISAEAGGKHGRNLHMAVVDELHEQPSRDLVDTIRTSFAATNRKQPLLIYLTTSDWERESICNEIVDYARKVRDGIIANSRFLPVMYEATSDDDWRDEKVWAKANPNIDISISRDYLRAECKRAQEVPAYENTFKRLHLNIKTQQRTRWLDITKWDACEAVIDLERLAARQCYIGLDLGKTNDITAAALVFPPTETDGMWTLLPKFWIPEERAAEREKQHRVPYLLWQQQGFIDFTPGNVTDYDCVKAWVLAQRERFGVQEVAYDPWNAMHLATSLTAEGVPMVEFQQSIKHMNEPAKLLEGVINDGKCRHDDNPVMRWMVANAEVYTDASGNIRPVKPEHKSPNKIDGVTATVNAIGRAIVKPPEPESVYETRGMLEV